MHILDPDWIYARDFNSIADKILNSCLLNLKGHRYRICEIEMYFKSKGHDDLYVHNAPDLYEYHNVYFHKFPCGSFKGGNYKGFGPTFGSKEDGRMFGVLIRAIEDVLTHEFIQGPSKVVDRVLSHYNCVKVAELYNMFEFTSILHPKAPVRIEIDAELIQKKIHKGPRIGLSDKYPVYRDLPYRYAIYVDKIKKKKKSLIEI